MSLAGLQDRGLEGGEVAGAGEIYQVVEFFGSRGWEDDGRHSSEEDEVEEKPIYNGRRGDLPASDYSTWNARRNDVDCASDSFFLSHILVRFCERPSSNAWRVAIVLITASTTL